MKVLKSLTIFKKIEIIKGNYKGYFGLYLGKISKKNLVLIKLTFPPLCSKPNKRGFSLTKRANFILINISNIKLYQS